MEERVIRLINVTGVPISAELFATVMHEGQIRKYTREPYIEHPREVAAIVQSDDHTPNMVEAAWLHDVCEDCGISFETIQFLFGNTTTELVWWLTDISRPFHGNRAARKALDRKHIAMAPAAAQIVKLADLLSNTKSIVEHDPDFAKVYLQEKRLILTAILDSSGYIITFKMTNPLSHPLSQLWYQADSILRQHGY